MELIADYEVFLVSQTLTNKGNYLQRSSIAVVSTKTIPQKLAQTLPVLITVIHCWQL